MHLCIKLPSACFLKQESDIDNIHQLVVGATENVKEGNEDIREVDLILYFVFYVLEENITIVTLF